jgi:hypothetical protein
MACYRDSFTCVYMTAYTQAQKSNEGPPEHKAEVLSKRYGVWQWRRYFSEKSK